MKNELKMKNQKLDVEGKIFRINCKKSDVRTNSQDCEKDKNNLHKIMNRNMYKSNDKKIQPYCENEFFSKILKIENDKDFYHTCSKNIPSKKVSYLKNENKYINNFYKSPPRKILSKFCIKLAMQKTLSRKYASSKKTNDINTINNFIQSKNCHMVSLFKDYMIYDYIDEFLKRVYLLEESRERIPKFVNYYKNYLKFFCNPQINDFKFNSLVQKYGDTKAEIYYNQNYKNIKKKNSKKDENDENLFDTKIKAKISEISLIDSEHEKKDQMIISHHSNYEINRHCNDESFALKFDVQNFYKKDSEKKQNFSFHNGESILKIVEDLNRADYKNELTYEKCEGREDSKITDQEIFKQFEKKIIGDFEIRSKNNLKLPKKEIEETSDKNKNKNLDTLNTRLSSQLKSSIESYSKNFKPNFIVAKNVIIKKPIISGQTDKKLESAENDNMNSAFNFSKSNSNFKQTDENILKNKKDPSSRNHFDPIQKLNSAYSLYTFNTVNLKEKKKENYSKSPCIIDGRIKSNSIKKLSSASDTVNISRSKSKQIVKDTYKIALHSVTNTKSRNSLYSSVKNSSCTTAKLPKDKFTYEDPRQFKTQDKQLKYSSTSALNCSPQNRQLKPAKHNPDYDEIMKIAMSLYLDKATSRNKLTACHNSNNKYTTNIDLQRNYTGTNEAKNRLNISKCVNINISNHININPSSVLISQSGIKIPQENNLIIGSKQQGNNDINTHSTHNTRNANNIPHAETEILVGIPRSNTKLKNTTMENYEHDKYINWANKNAKSINSLNTKMNLKIDSTLLEIVNRNKDKKFSRNINFTPTGTSHKSQYSLTNDIGSKFENKNSFGNNYDSQKEISLLVKNKNNNCKEVNRVELSQNKNSFKFNHQLKFDKKKIEFPTKLSIGTAIDKHKIDNINILSPANSKSAVSFTNEIVCEKRNSDKEFQKFYHPNIKILLNSKIMTQSKKKN